MEGGTAGICYIFDTLFNNFLLNHGDKIALMLPTFAPYLEIPELPKYAFEIVKVQAKQTMIDGKMTYQYPDEEINKLRDSDIKAVFVVNPSNPTANALAQPTIDLLKEIVATDNPELMILTDRIVADSRDVALNHAAGLSAPQQVMMVMFSLYSLLDEGQAYKAEVMDICRQREKLLFNTLGLQEPLEDLDTAYYCEINYEDWTRKRYGNAFADYLKNKWTVTKVLTSLAEKEQLMLLKANAFGSGEWAVRVSLANLATNQYPEVGKRIIRLTDEIRDQWMKTK